MLKRKIFAVALPIIAGATIVGSGFAAWVFNATTTPKSTKIGVSITDQTDFKDLKIQYSYNVVSLDNQQTESTLENLSNSEIKLILDQGMNDFDGTSPEKGIWFKLINSNQEYALKGITIKVINENQTLDKLISAGYGVHFSSTMTFDTNLKKVVELKSANTWSDSLFTGTEDELNALKKNVTLSQTKVLIDDKESYTINFASERENSTSGLFFGANSIFKYHSVTEGETKLAKPKNSTTYETFKTAVNACTTGIKLESSLTLVEAKA